MNLAALETATAVTAVAVGDEHDVAEVVADDRRRHTEALAPALEGLLARRGLAARDLDVVVVDVGPGLFTGLRVGVATAKGLAVAAGIRLAVVTSTDALAAAAAAAGVTGEVCCVVDARRAEVFSARYRCAEGIAEPVSPVELDAPGALAARLERVEGLTLVGDGAVRHHEAWHPGHVVRDDLVVPSPAAAIRLTIRRLGAGAPTLAHRDVHPWYVREADAVANFAVREAR